jgi:hypothetical protein
MPSCANSLKTGRTPRPQTTPPTERPALRPSAVQRPSLAHSGQERSVGYMVVGRSKEIEPNEIKCPMLAMNRHGAAHD